jgi:hypothetical protein
MADWKSVFYEGTPSARRGARPGIVSGLRTKDRAGRPTWSERPPTYEVRRKENGYVYRLGF